jgi:Recombination protein U
MPRGNGPKNRKSGADFERFLEMNCRMSQALFIKIPLGCRRLGRNRLIPIISPFDYILVKHGVSAFIDCKTYDKESIAHSDLTTHQVNTLSQVQESGAIAGYLVWHRPINQVVFYEAKKLFELRPRQSLGIMEGKSIGPCEKINLDLLLNLVTI